MVRIRWKNEWYLGFGTWYISPEASAGGTRAYSKRDMVILMLKSEASNIDITGKITKRK